jgi:hypothetical protein
LKILWKKDLDNKNSMPFSYECNFFVQEKSILFACSIIDYENITKQRFRGEKIILYDFNKFTGEFIKKSISFKYEETTGNKLLLSGKWEFYTMGNRLFLYVGKHLDIGSKKIKVVSKKAIAGILEENSISEYRFKNKIIRYNGRMGIECLENISGKLIWKHKLKGYIYTKIEYKKGCLIFGTAGMGGALYCIELTTGNIKRDVSNGGVSHYEWFQDTIFITDSKYNFQRVDPYSNKTIDRLDLKDKMTGYSPVKVDDNRVYTVVFNKKSGIPSVLCVKV